MTQGEFAPHMKRLCGYFNREPREELVREWFDRFAQYEVGVFRKTVDTLIETGRFFPTIREAQEVARSAKLWEPEKPDPYATKSPPWNPARYAKDKALAIEQLLRDLRNRDSLDKQE